VGIGAWLLQSADRWVVAQFFGSAPAGLFAFASSIGTIVPTFAVGSLMPVVFPGVFRAADQARSRGDWRRIARQCDQITGILLILAVVGLVAAWAIAPHLVGPLIAPAYRDSVVMIVPAGLAALAAQVNQFNYMLLQGQHKSMDMVRVMFAVAGVKTLGSVIAAAWSWPIFLSWLVLSPVVCGWLGRTLIRRYALGPAGGIAITEAGISDRTGDPPG
jgi:O-antigen/teichoic acid export membrane protein